MSFAVIKQIAKLFPILTHFKSSLTYFYSFFSSYWICYDLIESQIRKIDLLKFRQLLPSAPSYEWSLANRKKRKKRCIQVYPKIWTRSSRVATTSTFNDLKTFFPLFYTLRCLLPILNLMKYIKDKPCHWMSLHVIKEQVKGINWQEMWR